jgi:predicted RNA methylase
LKQFKRDENQNSNKLHLDKYYTPQELAKHCINKTYELVGIHNITEVIEPSAGNGSFSRQIDSCIAYDIEPEFDSIIKQDFLSLILDYKKGRLIIGNPPYGSRNTLSVQFYKKAIQLGDYIAFILPISQLNNNQQMYEFDLVHSEDLGIHNYSGRKVHCCFNIYKRPQDKLNEKPSYKLKDVEIVEVRLQSKTVDDYDLKICAWGASIGKEIKGDDQFAKEFYIKIHNDDFKEEVLTLLKKADWRSLYSMTSTPNLLQWQVYKYIMDKVKNIA